MLAPIGLSTYSRLAHIKQTVDALRKNALAADSELCIFSDGPRIGDEEKVWQVREYLKTIDGFKKINIVEREENNRTYNNRQGMRTLLDKYGKLIWLEEDIVTAPGFLRFMNQALDTYESNLKIFSIAGYCPPIKIPRDYPHDVFLLPRFNAWGFGIWKDRFDKIEMTLNKRDVYKLFLRPLDLYAFSRGGLDMLPMILSEANGKLDALDVKCFFQQFYQHTLTVYPTMSLVQNVGFDGSGMHCASTSRFDVDVWIKSKEQFVMPDDLIVNPYLLKLNYAFMSGDFQKRLRILYRIIIRIFGW